jgi:hypothetical protein
MIKREYCLNVDGLHDKTVLCYGIDGKKVYLFTEHEVHLYIIVRFHIVRVNKQYSTQRRPGEVGTLAKFEKLFNDNCTFFCS